jgi:1-aminocyclopropane-1-carboxylate deaminase
VTCPVGGAIGPLAGRLEVVQKVCTNIGRQRRPPACRPPASGRRRVPGAVGRSGVGTVDAVSVELTPVRELRLRLPSPLEELHDDRLSAAGVRVLLKRDDLLNPEIPGNKWRKLKYNLIAAAEAGQSKLLTFGGAFSNHLQATAAAGYYFGFDTVGIVRGEEHLPLNPGLAYAVSRGMKLSYMDRTTYRNKDDRAVVDRLRDQFGEFYLLPEGGSNVAALHGCAEMVAEIPVGFDRICCACGTGGTLAGLAEALAPSQSAIGFAALKGGDFLVSDIRDLQAAYGTVTSNWSVETRFHFGGFARRTPELNAFIEDFDRRHSMRLDWVYVAKMMYGIFAMVEEGTFSRGEVLVAVVTG